MTIALAMIVKDEAAVIGRCLESVRGLIDAWVIVDTGSTDGTQELIWETMREQGVSGQLHERPWVDFGHNRSELLELARGAADYLLLLDADMTVTWRASRRAYEPEGLDGATSYLVRFDETPEYWLKCLISGRLQWRSVGVTHEYTYSEQDTDQRQLDSLVITHHGDGSGRSEKLVRDLELLKRAHEQDPNDPRTVFYLAQTYRDLGDDFWALKTYKQRYEMGGWPEEVFYSLYQVGVLHARLEHPSQAVYYLTKAWSARPQRIEPLYELAWMYREWGMPHASYMVTLHGLGVPAPGDLLFVSRWIYDWGLRFEHALAQAAIGDPGVIETCDELLALEELPEEYRAATERARAWRSGS